MSPSPIPALVEPAVLRWARESIGLDQVAAARKMHLPDDRVADWERGDASPTIAQLREAARVYKRPLGVFFLAEPPRDFDAMRDFRRLHTTGPREWSPELHGEYRRALTQRDYTLELAELEDEPVTHAWVIEVLPDTDEALASAARTLMLGLAPLEFPGSRGSAYDHLNFWVAALEEAGILVLATQRGSVAVTEMRAFSLFFSDVPVIVVNGSDAARGRLFSLLHEYAHLLLRTGGLCDAIADDRALTPDRQLEVRRNAIAAAILMPAAEVLRTAPVVARPASPSSWDYGSLKAAAAPFGVSAEAFLRRLLTLERVSRSFYLARRAEFQEAYEEEEAGAGSGGGDWYRNTARDLGKGFVRAVADAYRRRIIDSYTAASFLNVKVNQISRLADEAALRARR